MMKKETWIKAVLSSELRTATASPELFSKIKKRIQEEQISVRWALPLAAAGLLLIGINVAIILSQKSASKNNSQSLEFTYMTTSNQLYSYVEN
jgi:hypothetical protein